MRSYFSITQTSRQLRHEFGGLFLASFKPTIRLHDLPVYLDAFRQTPQSPQLRQVISIVSNLAYTSGDVDVLPVFTPDWGVVSLIIDHCWPFYHTSRATYVVNTILDRLTHWEGFLQAGLITGIRIETDETPLGACYSFFWQHGHCGYETWRRLQELEEV
jgi:hypothetical protein